MAEMSKEAPLTFDLLGGELKKYHRWKAKHDKTCPDKGAAIGGRITFSFTPTGIGTVVVVKCACGEEKNVTDFDRW